MFFSLKFSFWEFAQRVGAQGVFAFTLMRLHLRFYPKRLTLNLRCIISSVLVSLRITHRLYFINALIMTHRSDASWENSIEMMMMMMMMKSPRKFCVRHSVQFRSSSAVPAVM